MVFITQRKLDFMVIVQWMFHIKVGHHMHKPVPFGPFATQDDIATSYFVMALPSMYG